MNIVDRSIPVFQFDEPNLGYEANEFQIRKDPEAGVFYAGSDGGCSCYEGFNSANFEPFENGQDLRRRFSEWISLWHDGVGHEAAAWEAFNEAIH